MAEKAVLSLAPTTSQSAGEEVRGWLEDARRRLGFVPAMYANMANAPALLGTYLYGYRRFREESGFTPVEQETVFLALSVENGCRYCTAAHSALAAKAGMDRAVLEALREGAPLPDPPLHALAELARTLWRRRGRLTEADVRAFVEAGFGERQVLYVLLAAAVKTISNWSNHLFATEPDPAFAPFAPPADRGTRVAG